MQEANNVTEKVLVTGASGFIGGHVVDEARSRGLDVVSFDAS